MLEAIIGTMKSEKTSSLIDKVKELSETKRVKVFYPSHCNKLDGYVYSRKDDKKIKGIKVFTISDLYNNIENVDVIFIDEVQFIVNLMYINDFMKFLEHVDTKNIDVYLVGLQLDYMSSSFEIIQRILPYMDKITILNAKCEICGADNATRCIRYNDKELDCDPFSSLILMESDKVVYKSVCKDCYRKLTSLPAIK